MIAQTYEVYLVDGQPHGYEIEKSYPHSADGYERAFAFFGTRAAVVIVSNDRTVNYLVALDFAKAVAFRTLKCFIVDLNKVNECKYPTRTKK